MLHLENSKKECSWQVIVCSWLSDSLWFYPRISKYCYFIRWLLVLSWSHETHITFSWPCCKAVFFMKCFSKTCFKTWIAAKHFFQSCCKAVFFMKCFSKTFFKTWTAAKHFFQSCCKAVFFMTCFSKTVFKTWTAAKHFFQSCCKAWNTYFELQPNQQP